MRNGKPVRNTSKPPVQKGGLEALLHMGVDQKVLARSYAFGHHSSWLKSSAKDRRWSSRKKLILSRKIPRWILGGMPVHLHICRPRSLVDREIRSTYTCIIDSLPVLGMVQINSWLGYFGASFAKDPRKTGERPGSLLQGFRTSPASASGKGEWR